MNNALILGCSHAAGSEMYDGVNNSYPVQLSKKLNLNPINMSIGGGSNDAMFRIFDDFVDVNKITSKDTVIACWTGSQRTETVYNDLWTPIVSGVKNSPIQDYIKQWCVYDSDHWHWRLNKIKNIISLNEIACKAGIKVINIHSFCPIEGYKPFDLHTEYHWPCADDCFVDWCLANNYMDTASGHFFEDAHTAFAEHVYKCLTINE